MLMSTISCACRHAGVNAAERCELASEDLHAVAPRPHTPGRLGRQADGTACVHAGLQGCDFHIGDLGRVSPNRMRQKTPMILAMMRDASTRPRFAASIFGSAAGHAHGHSREPAARLTFPTQGRGGGVRSPAVAWGRQAARGDQPMVDAAAKLIARANEEVLDPLSDLADAMINLDAFCALLSDLHARDLPNVEKSHGVAIRMVRAGILRADWNCHGVSRSVRPARQSRKRWTDPRHAQGPRAR